VQKGLGGGEGRCYGAGMNRKEFLTCAGMMAGSALLPAGLRAATADEAEGIREFVRAVYRAYSVTRDPVAYRALLADGYLLLEHGEIMTAEQDVAAMPKPGSDYQRSDSFEFHQVKTSGDVAWAVYTLRSDMQDAAKGARHRDYLENIILRRTGNSWQVALLHSTRLEPAKK
jgi:ketosteroid isomerase-like protein